ncbi:MAG: sporulation protein YqfD [Christensenellales bacterium]
MLKNRLKNRLKLNILGVNLKRLIKNLYKNNIDIFDLEQTNHKELNITINAKDLKKITPMLKDYTFCVTQCFGLSRFKNVLAKRIGLCLVAVLFFVALFFNSNFLSKIYVFGINQIDENEITEFLGQKGIANGTFFENLDTEKLETELESRFSEISLCSVMKKGTNLIINIKEKIIATDFVGSSDIVAKESGKILELNVVQGTSRFRVGDSVKKGDVLIAGFFESGENKVPCKAIGNIKMQVWYSTSVNFVEEEKVFQRTGNFVENSYYEIFGKRMKMKVKNVSFANFEKETKTEYLFKNLLVPIKIYKEIYYEIEENLIKNDFSLQKDAIIDTIIKQTLAKVPNGEEICGNQIEISNTQKGKIVTCYVETIQCVD